MSAATMTATAGRKPWRLNIDLPLVVIVGGLLMLGLIMVSSASISIADSGASSPHYYLQRQLIAALMGIAAAGLALCIPSVVWEKTGFWLLLLAFVLLIVVLLPGAGYEVNGSTRWVRWGAFNLQVSEPARMLVFLYVAGYIVRRQEELGSRFLGLLWPMLGVGAACGLLLLEPDFGAASVLLATALGMLFVGGARLRDIVLSFVVIMAGVYALVKSEPYRLERWTSFLNPWSDPYDSGFQLTQSLIAFGRGEWFGVGLGSSVQKLLYLPEAHTDFIFAVLAEELGLIGALMTLTLFIALVWRILGIGRMAAEAGKQFQAILCSGIGIWLGLQSLINIGVAMGRLPTKGLTLPLISYGGSSLLITLISLGLVLRVYHEVTTGKKRKTRAGARLG